MPLLELALVGQVLLWLIIVGVFLASGQASIFHPLTIYLAFHGVVFVARPLLVHYVHFDSVFYFMRISPTEQDYIKTLAVSAVALVIFSVSCFLAGRIRSSYAMVPPPPLGIEEIKALVVTTLVLSPLVAYSILISNTGGVTGESRGGIYVMTGASGYTADAQLMAGPLICLWLAATRFSRIGLLPLIAYVGYRSYCGVGRWTIVLLFLALAVIYAWQKRVRWLPLWSVALAVPLFMLFLAIGHNRALVNNLLTGQSVDEAVEPMTEQEKLKAKYDTQEFANFDYLCYVVKFVPDRTGTFTYGTQYLQLFTEPIPRKLWPGKPLGAPVGMFNLNSYGNFYGLTVGFPGDAWMTGGWIGLIIVIGFLGLVLGRAHRWFWNHSSDNVRALFYLVALAMLPQWFRDGGIGLAKFLLWNWLPLIIWLATGWLLGPRSMPGYSVLLPRGVGLRLIKAGTGDSRE